MNCCTFILLQDRQEDVMESVSPRVDSTCLYCTCTGDFCTCCLSVSWVSSTAADVSGCRTSDLTELCSCWPSDVTETSTCSAAGRCTLPPVSPAQQDPKSQPTGPKTSIRRCSWDYDAWMCLRNVSLQFRISEFRSGRSSFRNSGSRQVLNPLPVTHQEAQQTLCSLFKLWSILAGTVLPWQPARLQWAWFMVMVHFLDVQKIQINMFLLHNVWRKECQIE